MCCFCDFPICVLNHNRAKCEVGAVKHVQALPSKADPFSYLCFMCVFVFAALSVSCRLAITWWESADLLALLCVMCSCFCHIPIWYHGVSTSI